MRKEDWKMSSIISRLLSMFSQRCIISGLSLSALITALVIYHRRKRSQKEYQARLNYPDLSNGETLIGRILTEELWSKLYIKRTSNGFSIQQAIQIGEKCQENKHFRNLLKVSEAAHRKGDMSEVCRFIVEDLAVDLRYSHHLTSENPDHSELLDIGLIAGDENTYETLSELFLPVIELRHQKFRRNDLHVSQLDSSKVLHGKLDSKYVVSCRVRAARSIKGYNFIPALTRADMREVEQLIHACLENMKGDLCGQYHQIYGMQDDKRDRLARERLLFVRPISPLDHDWPDARAIFYNKSKTFVVWVNEEDHVRVISIQKGGNMNDTFDRFCRGVQEIEAELKNVNKQFMWNNHLGYLSTCPSNIGTAMKASVQIRLPRLSKDARFEPILFTLQLRKRRVGSHFDSEIFDVWNNERLGLTEVQLVQTVIDGVNRLIEIEKALELGKNIETLLPYRQSHSDTNVHS